MQVVLLYLREFFVVSPISKFKNNLTDIFEYFMNDLRENIFEFAQSVSHAYCRLLRTQTSCLFPEFYMTTENRFPFAIKMPKKIELSNVIHWNEDELIRLLPFICCVSPLYCHSLYIEEFEAEDLKLLKGGRLSISTSTKQTNNTSSCLYSSLCSKFIHGIIRTKSNFFVFNSSAFTNRISSCYV